MEQAAITSINIDADLWHNRDLYNETKSMCMGSLALIFM